MKPRSLEQTLRDRLDEENRFIQVLLGPRQVGKTTAVKSVIGRRGFYESADSPIPMTEDFILEWWKEAETSPDKILAIDEIQKIPAWSEVIKRLWDSRKTVRVLVTGSSSLLLEKGLRETLAGRFEIIRAEHWNYQEAQDVFAIPLDEYIEFGCYPGSITLMDDVSRWSQYIRDSIIEPILGRDLLQLHPVDNPALLRQVFGVALSLPAQIVSLQKIQGQIQSKGSLPTISHYLDLLADAFLVTGVNKFTGSAYQSGKSSPKLFVHDNALMRCLTRPVMSPIDSDTYGHFFENSIGSRFIESGWETFYWRDRDHEVDLVVLGPRGEKLAIEVKWSKVSRQDLGGLDAFCKKYKEFRPCLISREHQVFDGITSLSAEEVLSLNRLSPTGLLED